MQIRNFDDAFTLLMGNEKGFTDNPKDPGNWTSGKVGEGECKGTMWGVSCRVAAEEGYTGDMRNLPQTLAKGIAKRRYWDPYQLDQLDPEIAFQVFDAAYNGGAASKWLQLAVGAAPDGVIGAKTIAAVRGMDKRSVIMRFDASRLRYLAKLNNPTFASGWMNRIANNLDEGAD